MRQINLVALLRGFGLAPGLGQVIFRIGVINAGGRLKIGRVVHCRCSSLTSGGPALTGASPGGGLDLSPAVRDPKALVVDHDLTLPQSVLGGTTLLPPLTSQVVRRSSFSRYFHFSATARLRRGLL